DRVHPPEGSGTARTARPSALLRSGQLKPHFSAGSPVRNEEAGVGCGGDGGGRVPGGGEFRHAPEPQQAGDSSSTRSVDRPDTAPRHPIRTFTCVYTASS